MSRVAHIFRYPVKGLGQDELSATQVVPGIGIPGDRKWALAHKASSFDAASPAHVPRRNFVQTAHCASLAQTSTTLEGDTRLSLSHPDHGEITADLAQADGAQTLCDWAEKVAGPDQPGPYILAHVPQQPMWDVAEAPVSLASTKMLEILSQKIGSPLQMRRFRNNIWLTDLAPGEEFDLVGREITIGEVRLNIMEPNTRCAAPGANPATGKRDLDVTGFLHETYGHMDFGIYASVVTGGRIAVGDTLTT